MKSNVKNLDTTNCLLVGFDFSKREENKDTGVLIVGQKRGKKDVDIVNAFQGQEAWDLYQKLITRKEKNND